MYRRCRRGGTIRALRGWGTIRALCSVLWGTIRAPVKGTIRALQEMASAAVNFVERGPGLLVAGVADALVLSQSFEQDRRGLDRRIRLLLGAEGTAGAKAALVGCTGDVLSPREGRLPCYRARALGWLEAPPLFRWPYAFMVGQKRQPVEVGPRFGRALWPSPMGDDDETNVHKLSQCRRYFFSVDARMGFQLAVGYGELS